MPRKLIAWLSNRAKCCWGCPIPSAPKQQTQPAAPAQQQPQPAGSHSLTSMFHPRTFDPRGTDYPLPVFPKDDPSMLKGKRVLIVIGDCPELPEVAVPLKYFRERGATVKIAGQNWIRQWRTPSLDIAIGQYIACDVATTADLTVSEVKADDFDLVVFPGGAWSPDSLRVDPDVQRIIREFYWKGKLVASICHGPWVFINASVDAPEGQKNFPLSGMNVTGVTNIRLDLKNAGGIVHTDQPVVVDNNVITSRDPNDLGPFCETLGKMLVQ